MNSFGQLLKPKKLIRALMQLLLLLLLFYFFLFLLSVWLTYYSYLYNTGIYV